MELKRLKVAKFQFFRRLFHPKYRNFLTRGVGSIMTGFIVLKIFYNYTIFARCLSNLKIKFLIFKLNLNLEISENDFLCLNLMVLFLHQIAKIKKSINSSGRNEFILSLQQNNRYL